MIQMESSFNQELQIKATIKKASPEGLARELKLFCLEDELETKLKPATADARLRGIRGVTAGGVVISVGEGSSIKRIAGIVNDRVRNSAELTVEQVEHHHLEL